MWPMEKWKMLTAIAGSTEKEPLNSRASDHLLTLVVWGFDEYLIKGDEMQKMLVYCILKGA